MVEVKKAIVVGATSGIGRGLAELLVKNNYKVGITGRRENLLTELQKTNPDKFVIKTFDVTDTKTSIEKLNELVTELDGLELLILSSGTGDINPSLDFAIEKRTIGTNVLGFTNIADWAFNFFANQKHGHFAAITSIGGLRGSGVAPAYNASKSYQMNYLEGLRQKASKLDGSITVTDIRPGFVNTDMAKGDKLFWVMPVDKITNQIYSAIKKKKKVVYVSKRWGILAQIIRALPKFIYDRM